MIGPEPPQSYDLDAWRAHIADLRATEDYPWREDQIYAAEETLRTIEAALDETGDPPSAEAMLRSSAAGLSLTP